jgi:hypothetical protein
MNPINFNNLPGDIKSIIYRINRTREEVEFNEMRGLLLKNVKPKFNDVVEHLTDLSNLTNDEFYDLEGDEIYGHQFVTACIECMRCCLEEDAVLEQFDRGLAEYEEGFTFHTATIPDAGTKPDVGYFKLSDVLSLSSGRTIMC